MIKEFIKVHILGPFKRDIERGLDSSILSVLTGISFIMFLFLVVPKLL